MLFFHVLYFIMVFHTGAGIVVYIRSGSVESERTCFRKNTVLVIENELPIRKVLAISLESSGYKIMEYDNGKEGASPAATLADNFPQCRHLDFRLSSAQTGEPIPGLRYLALVIPATLIVVAVSA